MGDKKSAAGEERERNGDGNVEGKISHGRKKATVVVEYGEKQEGMRWESRGGIEFPILQVHVGPFLVSFC